MFRTYILIAVLLAALLGILVASGREAQRRRTAGRGDARPGGRTERCVSCHVKPEEDPGGAHSREALGCATCHLGNPLAFGKERAHAGLEREPGALATVALTCGREGCHPREAARVVSSPMNRASGIVAVDRWAFGEIPAPDSDETMADVLAVSKPSPAESHLRKLCAGCHLGTRRANRDDAVQGNGSGCAACHVAPRRRGDPPRPHPPVDSRVSDDRCLGCHSRSGRISLSYRGLAEVEPDQRRGAGTPCASPVTLHDGRPGCRVEPDVHAAAGLACVDCHLHTELMGDGVVRRHKEEQVEVTCEACHGPVAAGGEVPWSSIDEEITRGILRMKKSEIPPGAPARLGRRGTPLWNLLRISSSPSFSSSSSLSASGWTLVRKLDGKPLPVKQTPRDANHEMKGHERVVCSACHAAWAPSCTTCHTRSDPGTAQWDFAAGNVTSGAWVERSEGFSWGPPLLGLRADGAIVPAVPGMILDVDATSTGGTTFSRRLLAPLEPHTTGKKARTCRSCHLLTDALRFEGGTRTGFRPLGAAEERRIRLVGECLPCHSKASNPVWRDFRISVDRLARGSRCPFPPQRARQLGAD